MHSSTESLSTVVDRRIEVTVLTGFLGSGKTTLLNRLVRHASYADAVVIVNELGEIGVDHHLLRYAQGRIALIEGGCICCTVSGDMVNALRDLFMSALRRQIPRFRHVLIETTGLATPAGVLFTLRHDPFLAERYVHRGTITVVDATHIQRQLSAQPEVVEQLAAADVVVCAKVDLIESDRLGEITDVIKQVNPGASISMQRIDDVLDGVIVDWSVGSGRAPRATLNKWLNGALSLGRATHPRVQHVVVNLPVPMSRAVFLTGMARFQDIYHEGLLRIKGVVGFSGEGVPCVVHGVHGQLYPLESLAGGVADDDASWLVLIVRGLNLDQVVRELQQCLGQTER